MAIRARLGFRLRRYAGVLLAVSIMFTGTGASAAICRVAVDGVAGNDGLGWTTPKDLHGALADTGCSELWLKQGVYKPVSTTTAPTAAERAITFQISRDLLLYGGFAGTEDTLDARDPVAHRTILSGDIQGDDINEDGNFIAEWAHTAPDATYGELVGGNSFHVLTLGGQNGSSVTAATLIDGITITAGMAPASAPLPVGAGLFCWADAPNSVCSPRLNDVDFSGNYARQYGGGMMSRAAGADSVSSPSLTRVRFSGNNGSLGGGLANMTAGGSGNSTSNLNHSSPSLVDVSFTGNKGGQGGAMYSFATRYSTTSPELRRVTFSGNTAEPSGGAMYIRAAGIPSVVSPVLSEVTFSNNSAFQNGGAIYFEATGAATGAVELNPVFNHVTFANNSAFRGGALANDYAGGANNFSPSFSHVVFWGNHATFDDDFYFLVVNDAFFEYTILADGCVPWNDENRIITCGDGNSTADPQLGPLQDNGGFTQTHLPGPGSSAIDAGIAAPCLSDTDQRGVPRPQGSACDIGAVEVHSSGAIFANGFEND